jgi:Mce-associated membrane protein
MTGPAGTPTGTPAGSVAGTPAASDDVDDGQQEPLDDAEPAWRRRLPGGRRVWTIGVLSVVVLALVAALVAVVRAPTDREVRESALLAARTYTTSLTTFDARTFDADAERVRRSSTAEFAAEYDQTVEGLRESVESQRLVSTGTVVGAGLEELGGGTATVLVAVNQEILTPGAQARTEANRLRMVLQRSDGRWLIQDVQRL